MLSTLRKVHTTQPKGKGCTPSYRRTIRLGMLKGRPLSVRCLVGKGNTDVIKRYNFSKVEGDKDMLELIPQMELSCNVRDNLFQDVFFALQDNRRLPVKLKGLIVLRKSLELHFGGIEDEETKGKVLIPEETLRLLTPQAIDDYILIPLKNGCFLPCNKVRSECAKILLGCTTYLDLNSYKDLFTHSVLQSLLILVEYGIVNRGISVAIEEMRSATISIFQNLLSVAHIPNEMLIQLIDRICTKYDYASVEFCHNYLTKVVFPNLSLEKDLDMKHALCVTPLMMCRRIVRYLCSLLINARDYEIISSVCYALSNVVIHHYGIELLLHEGCVTDLIRMALLPVANYDHENSMIKGGKIPHNECSQTITKCNETARELSYDTVSIISALSFRASNKQIAELLELGIAEALIRIIQCPITRPLTTLKAATALGNLGGKTEKALQAVIDSGVISILINIFRDDTNYTAQLEAAYALCVTLANANKEQVKHILSCSAESERLGNYTCMSIITEMIEFCIRCDEENTLNMTLCRTLLSALQNMFIMGIKEMEDNNLTENPYMRLFLQYEGDVKLAKMLSLADYDISRQANQIGHRFFCKV